MDEQEYIDKINSLLQEGKFEEAMDCSAQGLNEHPDSADLYYLRAVVLWQKSEVFDLPREEFSNLLKKATDLDPFYAEPHKLWAYANTLLGYPELAELGYTRAIAAEPEDLNSYVLRGQVRISLKNFKGAVEDFTHIIEQKGFSRVENAGNGKSIYVLRAAARERGGDLTGALADYQKVLDLDPESKEALSSVQNLQKSLYQQVPEGTQGMECTLKNGRKAMVLPINGKMVTFYQLHEVAAKPGAAPIDEDDLDAEFKALREQANECLDKNKSSF